MPKIVKTEVVGGKLVTFWDDDTETFMSLSGPRLLREGDVPSGGGGGGASILPAPAYVVGEFEDQVIAPDSFFDLTYKDIFASVGHPSVPWDYSGDTPGWMATSGLPSSEIDLTDGMAVGTDGSFKIKEAGLYYAQAHLFITQGGGNTGDDQVGEFTGQLYFGHNAPFENMQFQNEETVKEVNADYMYLSGTIPIWDVCLPVNVIATAKHTSTGTLTVEGSVMLIRVS